ncbi:MAG: ribosome biogenesis GTPase YlqF [Cyanobacteria bacterium REEB67]|nr:ribosome biogenesis GTPase YlqF [Cyanobacteria bacterium REEB67]
MGGKDNKRQSRGVAGAKANAFAKFDAAAKPAIKRAPKRVPSTPFQRLTEIVKWVDLVIEVLDGRMPVSTRHPSSDQIFGNKPRVTIYSKMDLSDIERLKILAAEMSAVGGSNEADSTHRSLILSLKSRENKGKFIEAALAVTKAKRDSLQRRGILPRPMRACVVGIPNVGKSSLINWFIGQKRTKTGDMPGVTKGTQWIRVDPQLELLDTPGILPPVALSPETHDRLAFLNLVPPSTYNTEEIAKFGIAHMQRFYADRLNEYCAGLGESEDGLMHIAEVRRYLSSGARLDDLRAANIFLRDVRDGKLGRLTLD